MSLGQQYRQQGPASVKRLVDTLFDDLLAHDGYGQLEVFVRLLNRGQKEVIVRCGKEYRFVLDMRPPAPDGSSR